MKRTILAFILGSITALAADYAAACWAKTPALSFQDETKSRLEDLEMRIFILELRRESQDCLKPDFSEWHNKIDGEAVPI